jgi:dehydrogenase/reductase SDR family member 7B
MAYSPFHDNVVLITGASSGIGRALAAAFAKQGAHVVLVARNEAKLAALQQELAHFHGERLIAPADVRQPEQVHRAIDAALQRFSRIDVLINNAGIGYCGPVEQMTIDEFRNVFETNFFGAFLFTRAVASHMIQRRSGIIVQISSLNGFCAVPLGSAYCASKYALEALSQSARLELHKHNVHVLIVRPGVTDTEFFDNSKNFHEQNPFPIRNLMSAECVADAVVRAAARRQRDLVLTTDGKLLWWLKKLSPALVDRILMHYVKARPAPQEVAT